MKKITKKEYIKEIKKEGVGYAGTIFKCELQEEGVTMKSVAERAKKISPIYLIDDVIERSKDLKIKLKGDDGYSYHGFEAPNEFYKYDNILIHSTNGFIIYHRV